VYTEKDRIKVVIYTKTMRIEGFLHILAGSRVTDALNSKAKDFFAMTDCEFRMLDGGSLREQAVKYIAVNRESIEVVFPLEDLDHQIGEAPEPA
jgi:hypothetical protein